MMVVAESLRQKTDLEKLEEETFGISHTKLGRQQHNSPCYFCILRYVSVAKCGNNMEKSELCNSSNALHCLDKYSS